MHRRLRTLLVVFSAITLLLGIGIPTASARNRSARSARAHRHSRHRASPGRRHHFRTRPHHSRRRHARTTLPTNTTKPTTTRPTSTDTTAPTSVSNPSETPAPVPPAGTNAKPAAGGYFSILPPGSALPSGAACAARVHGSTWEPHPENNTANHTAPTNPGALANFSQWSSAWNASYKPRIDGNFQGATDEIIQWAACKWGMSDEVIRAEAVV